MRLRLTDTVVKKARTSTRQHLAALIFGELKLIGQLANQITVDMLLAIFVRG